VCYIVCMKIRKDDIVLDRFGGMFLVLKVLESAELAEVRRWGSSQVFHLVIGDWGDSRGLRKIVQ
jgi:hypothetical protein